MCITTGLAIHIIFAMIRIVGELQRIINVYHQLIIPYYFL